MNIIYLYDLSRSCVRPQEDIVPLNAYYPEDHPSDHCTYPLLLLNINISYYTKDHPSDHCTYVMESIKYSVKPVSNVQALDFRIQSQVLSPKYLVLGLESSVSNFKNLKSSNLQSLVFGSIKFLIFSLQFYSLKSFNL